MRVGKIGAVRVKINFCFFLLAGLFSAAGMAREALAVFFSVVLHEIAHVATARCCGYKISEVEILPFGGVARIEHFWERGKKKVLLVAASGPLLSFILACFCFFFAAAVDEEALRLLGQVNFALAGFNLLPAFPLDGGHIFRSVLMFFFPYQKATSYLAVSSGAVSFLLLFQLVYDFWVYQSANISFAIMALFILTALKRELKSSVFYTVRTMAYKKIDLLCQGHLETSHYTVEKSLKLKSMTKFFAAGSYTVILVLDENYKICGSFTETEIWEALAEKGMDVSFADLVP